MNVIMKNKVIFLLLGISPVFVFASLQDGLPASVERGKIVYESNCVSCHMADGKGLEGAFPPLAGTKRLTDKARLVKIVVNGTSGPMEVNGTTYDMEMMPLNLSDKEIMDVLNYVRNSWGNKAPAIDLKEVAKFKTEK
jgi:mono/diheme cytochrome c family protein